MNHRCKIQVFASCTPSSNEICLYFIDEQVSYILLFCTCLFIFSKKKMWTLNMITGRGTQIWFGWGCAARVSKPLLLFKGRIGWKRNPFLRIFSQNSDLFFKISLPKNCASITKTDLFWRKWDQCLEIYFLWISYSCMMKIGRVDYKNVSLIHFSWYLGQNLLNCTWFRKKYTHLLFSIFIFIECKQLKLEQLSRTLLQIWLKLQKQNSIQVPVHGKFNSVENVISIIMFAR